MPNITLISNEKRVRDIDGWLQKWKPIKQNRRKTSNNSKNGSVFKLHNTRENIIKIITVIRI